MILNVVWNITKKKKEEFEAGFPSRDTETEVQERDIEGNQETFWLTIPYCI